MASALEGSRALLWLLSWWVVVLNCFIEPAKLLLCFSNNISNTSNKKILSWVQKAQEQDPSLVFAGFRTRRK